MAINQNDIIYFLITDRFFGKENPKLSDVQKHNPFGFHGGNFEGIIEKIPYFKKLGVTTLWITPVYLQVPPIENRATGNSITGYHGYWALDFNSIDPHLYIDNEIYKKGSKKYLKDLVDELHRNGLKLVLDMVVNHTVYGHPGVNNSEPNPTPIRSNWFNRAGLDCSVDVIEGALSGLPDMDLDSVEVSDYHIQTIISWIKETGIDAIRMDTVKHVERVFWDFFKTEIRGVFPDVDLIGEVLVFDIDTLSEYQKYMAFDSLFDFPLQEAIVKAFIRDHSLKIFVSPFNAGLGILEGDKHYTNHNRLVTLLDNHDLSARVMSWAVDYVGGQDKIQYAAQLLNLANTFLMTVRGIPQIYYGTEVGLQGYTDPDNRRDFEWFKFDENYEIKPEYPVEKSIYDHIRKLIAIRKDNPALYAGNFVPLYVDDFILAYLRYVDDNAIIVIINNGWKPMPTEMKIQFNNNPRIPSRIESIVNKKELCCLLTGKVVKLIKGEIPFQLDGKSAMILK